MNLRRRKRRSERITRKMKPKEKRLLLIVETEQFMHINVKHKKTLIEVLPKDDFPVRAC
jgi:hypothetical protein